MTDVIAERMHGPIEIRTVGMVADVSFPKRMIEVIAVPYDQPAVVEYPTGSGNLITESIAPGAFEGVQTRTRAVKVNLDHDFRRTVGIVKALHPSRSEGLVAEIRVAPGHDQVLDDANEGILDASVGMAVTRDPSPDVEWSERRKVRRILKAFLDHIALTAAPAYAGAQVLSVRHNDTTGELFVPVVDEFADDTREWLEQHRLTSM